MSGSVENCSSVISLCFASECSGGKHCRERTEQRGTASNSSQKPRCEKLDLDLCRFAASRRCSYTALIEHKSAPTGALGFELLHQRGGRLATHGSETRRCATMPPCSCSISKRLCASASSASQIFWMYGYTFCRRTSARCRLFPQHERQPDLPAPTAPDRLTDRALGMVQDLAASVKLLCETA